MCFSPKIPSYTPPPPPQAAKLPTTLGSNTRIGAGAGFVKQQTLLSQGAVSLSPAATTAKTLLGA